MVTQAISIKIKRIYFLGLVLCAALGIVAYYQFSHGKQSLAQKQAVVQLFNLNLPDSEGHMHALKQHQGKFLVVNFWAPWCAPCREEMPLLSDAAEQFGSRQVDFVGLGLDEAAPIQAFARSFKLKFPLLHAGASAFGLSAELGNSLMALPFTVIINPEGELVHQKLGLLKPGEIQKILQPLLDNASGY